MEESEETRNNTYSTYQQYADQYNEMIELKAENVLLKDEIVTLDGSIDKLKQCIVMKLEKMNEKYLSKNFRIENCRKRDN